MEHIRQSRPDPGLAFSENLQNVLRCSLFARKQIGQRPEFRVVGEDGVDLGRP